MVARRRAEIPQNRLVILCQQREATDFVLGPTADMCRRQIADVVHVEAEKGPHLRLRKQGFGTVKALAAKAVEVNAIFPVHRHRSIGFQCHPCLRPPLTLRFSAKRSNGFNDRLDAGAFRGLDLDCSVTAVIVSLRSYSPARQTALRSLPAPGPFRALMSGIHW